MGALRGAVAHQRTQLQEAKAIIKQQGKELRDKDGEFEALKERLTGVDHPGALLVALIPADELQELMGKMDGKDPAMVGARAKVVEPGTTTAKRQIRVFSLLLEKVTALLTKHTPNDSSDLWKLLFQNSHWQKVLRECVSADAEAGKVRVLKPLFQGLKNAKKLSAQSTDYSRLFRQLLSLLADPQSNLTYKDIQAMLSAEGLEVTEDAIKEARKHALDNFAGCTLNKTKHRWVCIDQKTARHMAGYRQASHVVSLNKSNWKNTVGGKPLCRKNTRPKQYKLYVAECKDAGVKPYGFSLYNKVFGASIFTDKTGKQAACEICLDYLVHQLAEIKELYTTISWTLPEAGRKHYKAHLDTLHQTLTLHFEGGGYGQHCSDYQTSSTTQSCFHCELFALSDPNDEDFREECGHDHEMSCPSCNSYFYLRDSIAHMINRAQEEQTADLDTIQVEALVC
jgi:hypothetical protein